MRLAISGLALALVATTLVVAPLHPLPAATAPPSPPLIAPLPRAAGLRWISPDGDGEKDRARIGYRLHGSALVRAVVRDRDGHVVRRERVGRQHGRQHGRRAWTWDGRDQRGRVVADGHYRVWLQADPLRGEGRRDSFLTRVWTRRTFRVPADVDPRLQVSRPTLYPDTTAVADALFFWTDLFPHARSVGLRVTGEGYLWNARVTTPWDGRRTVPGGSRAPAGDYVATMTARDEYGNTRTDSLPVRIAPGQLRAESWSRTVTAATARTTTSETPTTGCGDLACSTTCPPTTPSRFPEGLHFAYAEGCDEVRQEFALTLPFVPDAMDQARISVTGGPTTPGSGAGGSVTGTFPSLAAPAGDGTTTSTWDFLVPGRIRPTPTVRWRFTLSPRPFPGSPIAPAPYDVASFTLEGVHYSPP